MNVLFIATRAPYGRMHGHKMGMRTYIRALQGLGHTVVVGAFDVPGDDVTEEDLGAVTRYLPMPPKWRVVASLLTHGASGRLSLNECLYSSPEAGRQIQGMVKEFAIDFVVADMIRTAAYAEAAELPWMLDHEDLLSERYTMWAGRSTGDENILGYLHETIPAFAKPLAKSLFRRLLSREAKVLRHRELYWTERALGSSLRSMEETGRLQARASHRVFCMPVSVPIPAEAADAVDAVEARPMTAVFTGGLTYQPNLDALRAYVDQIIPEFERHSIIPPVLNVIGAAPTALRAGLEHPSIRFLGYVPDVNEELCKNQVFFAPIVSGTGIKTKVLEAMACGLPLIALPAGLSGLSGEHGRDYLMANDAADFVQQFVRVRDDPSLARVLGRAGRELAIGSYSIEAATRVLGREIASVLPPPSATPTAEQSQRRVSAAASPDRMDIRPVASIVRFAQLWISIWSRTGGVRWDRVVVHRRRFQPVAPATCGVRPYVDTARTRKTL